MLTLLGATNFFVLQWFFVRLAAVFDSEGEFTGWTWLVGVVPLTGWWSPYKYLKLSAR